MDKDIKVTLKVWRQKGPKDKGRSSRGVLLVSR